MTNWPWPLDGIQAWLESLWNWISTAAVNAVSVVSDWVWSAATWISDRISEGLTWLKDHVLDPITGIFWSARDLLYNRFREAFNLVLDFTRDIPQPGKMIVEFLMFPAAFIYTFLKPAIDGIWAVMPAPLKQFVEYLRTFTADLWQGFVNFLKDPVGSLQAGWNALTQTIWEKVSWLRDRVSEGWTWLSTQISDGLSNLWTAISTTVGNVVTAVTGAVSGLWDSLTGLASDILSGVVNALGGALQGFWDWLLKHLTWIGQMIMGAVNSVIAAIQGFIVDLGRRFIDALTGIFTPGSPDKELETTMAVMVETMNKRVVDEIKAMYKSPPEAGTVIATAGTVATLLGIGILSVKALATAADQAHPIKNPGFSEIATSMIAATGASVAMSSLLRMPAEVGLLTPLRHAYNQMFTPEIPGSGDLVRMVVREAFDPKMIIKAPAEFVSAMKFQGFSETWSDRYWTAHFEPIALGQAYANLWRGYWGKEQFMYALHIADVHPMWREDIYAVAFRAPSARELGYGFDVGEYSVEDIAKFRRWEGLAPADAEKAARSMVAYRTESEREALRREALADFEAWLDDEPQLRVNLKAIGGQDEVIDLWVERAKYRRERDFILDMVKVSVDLHYKGHINDQGIDQDLIELGITPEGRQKIITEAKARRLKAVVAENIAKKKVMPEARVRQARDLGLISDPEYVQRLLDHDWAEEDARLDLAIELTPKPITVEEMERRRKTVTSKRARAVRRYETSLARIQDQIDLTAGQIEDTRITMEESLDVIDAQIAAVEADLAVAPPEKVADLEQRRLVLVQRRELQVTRWETRIRKLTEQHKNLLDSKDLLTRQRDEELAEYDNELALLEVAG